MCETLNIYIMCKILIAMFFAALSFFACAQTALPANGISRVKYNFNGNWQIHYPSTCINAGGQTKTVTLPRAWNEDYAYMVGIASLPDDTCRYTKTFKAPEEWRGKKVFVEFEGARQAAEVWLNGKWVGLHENGVMAFGFDLTPYLRLGQENILEVLTDNDWAYKERGASTRGEVVPDGNGLPNNSLAPATYQWNNKNFNMNMGGLPKNVYLHVTDEVYQTLPLYSNLGTTGVYVYGTDYDVRGRKVTAHVESQVINASVRPQKVRMQVDVWDNEGRKVTSFLSASVTIAAGDTAVLSAAKRLRDVHFWSWGYGYLYNVRSSLLVNGRLTDAVDTRTGFRKTRFADGKIWLNDRCLMVHGYAQRSSNEWPAVGMDVPAWMSDYSNGLMVKSGGNVVRWMHVTPSKQDVESCDRVGLIQAMPAGDAEKDVTGRHWSQRAELMRDAIIYNRNNPSILFYEGGNESISREHVLELIALRNLYDPYGGRAVGSREMLDIDESEYGGEMLYINKSKKHPMWAMEYCRDEGYRMYWDNCSYPYHQAGAGPLYRKASASVYNRNQDDFALEQVERWHDYYVVRPGMGDRVSSGGVKIIFSDTNTHGRSEMNYRTSGVVDAMRIEKDAFYAHQVMWQSWVDVQHSASHIIGHWNYQEGTVKDIHVISTSPIVELFVNGASVGLSTQAEHSFVHTFHNVRWEKGEVKAVSYSVDGGTVESECSHQTAGEPHHLRLSLMQNPDGGMRADGADLAIVQVEVVDKDGRRCPLDNRYVRWRLDGEGEWRGGIGKSPDGDNYILSTVIPVEAGVGRVLVRSTTCPGAIHLSASAIGLPLADISWESRADECRMDDGMSCYLPSAHLPSVLDRGETPSSPSFVDKRTAVAILSATAGANSSSAANSWDDNELSEWRNDGRLSTAWIAYTLECEAPVSEISIKLTGWRQRSYPLEVLAGDSVVWRGNTPKSLGYVSLNIDHPIAARCYTIRQIGAATDKEAFGEITELAGEAAAELDLYKTPGGEDVRGELRIVECDFLVEKK